MHVHFDARALTARCRHHHLLSRSIFISLADCALRLQLSSTAVVKRNMSLNSYKLDYSALASRPYWIYAVQPSANTAKAKQAARRMA